MEFNGLLRSNMSLLTGDVASDFVGDDDDLLRLLSFDFSSFSLGLDLLDNFLEYLVGDSTPMLIP